MTFEVFGKTVALLSAKYIFCFILLYVDIIYVKIDDLLVRRISICVCHLEITLKHEVLGLFKRGNIGYWLQILEINTEELKTYPALQGPRSRH